MSRTGRVVLWALVASLTVLAVAVVVLSHGASKSKKTRTKPLVMPEEELRLQLQKKRVRDSSFCLPILLKSEASQEEYYKNFKEVDKMSQKRLRASLFDLVRNQTVFSTECVSSLIPKLDISLNVPHKLRDVFSGEDLDRREMVEERIWAPIFGYPTEECLEGSQRRNWLQCIPQWDLHNVRATHRTYSDARGEKWFDSSIWINPNGDVLTWDMSTNNTMNAVQKAEVARIMFYLDLRYQKTEKEISLFLTTRERYPILGDPFHGNMCALYKWHMEGGPVSPAEIWRNNVVHRYQGNRNPFVDHPEWVDRLWGRRFRRVCPQDYHTPIPPEFQSKAPTLLHVEDSDSEDSEPTNPTGQHQDL